MTDFLLSLPTWPGILFAAGLSTTTGLVVYLVSHRFMAKRGIDELLEPSSSLFRITGVLVSLMLSLAFADVIVKLRSIDAAVQREAVAVLDNFKDLQLYDREGTRDIQLLEIEYARAVVADDWPALADDKLGQRTGSLHDQLQLKAFALQPETATQQALLSRILADLDAMSDYRLIRLDNALAEPPVYLYVVYFGFLLAMACFGVHRPQMPVVLLAALYMAMIGSVLYLILALSDPFEGGFGVSPVTFEHVAEEMQNRLQ